MSIAEIKIATARLTAAEKIELVEYLRGQVDPQWAARRVRVSELQREMDSGRKYSRADLDGFNRRLAVNRHDYL